MKLFKVVFIQVTDVGRYICSKFRPVPPRRGLEPGLIRFRMVFRQAKGYPKVFLKTVCICRNLCVPFAIGKLGYAVVASACRVGSFHRRLGGDLRSHGLHQTLQLAPWQRDTAGGNFNLQLQSGSTFVFAALALRYIIRPLTPLWQTESEISLAAESDFNFSSTGIVFRIILITPSTGVDLLASTSVWWNLAQQDRVRAFLMVAFAFFDCHILT